MKDQSFGTPLIDALAEASKILNTKQTECVYFHPAWEKLYHANEYIKKVQQQAVEEALGDPEKSDG